MGLPSVVVWIANSPAQFGYEMHTNIIANPPTLRQDLRYSVFTEQNTLDQPNDMPYESEDELFDADRIIEALNNLRKTKGGIIIPATSSNGKAEIKENAVQD